MLIDLIVDPAAPPAGWRQHERGQYAKI